MLSIAINLLLQNNFLFFLPTRSKVDWLEFQIVLFPLYSLCGISCSEH